MNNLPLLPLPIPKTFRPNSVSEMPTKDLTDFQRKLTNLKSSIYPNRCSRIPQNLFSFWIFKRKKNIYFLKLPIQITKKSNDDQLRMKKLTTRTEQSAKLASFISICQCKALTQLHKARKKKPSFFGGLFGFGLKNNRRLGVGLNPLRDAEGLVLWFLCLSHLFQVPHR